MTASCCWQKSWEIHRDDKDVRNKKTTDNDSNDVQRLVIPVFKDSLKGNRNVTILTLSEQSSKTVIVINSGFMSTYEPGRWAKVTLQFDTEFIIGTTLVPTVALLCLLLVSSV